jgi:hypothetical protein
MRSSLRRPIRCVSDPTETLSIKSRLTADTLGTGSSFGSSTTSLGSPRTMVVHGAITVLRSRGIATARDKTTTGRREISGSSHHQTSPRVGRPFMTIRPPLGMTQDRPTHRARLEVSRHKLHSLRQPGLDDVARGVRQAPHPAAQRRYFRLAVFWLLREALRPLLY